jgi:serum/glucocorticoid-regulated kinase 2
MYRDLKPENILIDLDGHVRITDFGLSKDNFKKRDRAQSFCGSPEYMSPDMLLGEQNVGPTTDVWSLGATMYELVTGCLPFQAEAPFGLVQWRAAVGEPLQTERLARFNSMDEELSRVIARALEKGPADRYCPDMMELLEYSSRS